MITPIAQSLIDDIRAVTPELGFEDVSAMRMCFDETLNAVKIAAKESLAKRFADERKALEDRFLAEARDSGVNLFGTDKTARQKNPPVYKNPEDPSKTWSGKGKKPNWFSVALANGVTAEDMRIPAEDSTTTA